MYHSCNFSLMSTIVITNLPNGWVIYLVNFGVLKSSKLTNDHLGANKIQWTNMKILEYFICLFSQNSFSIWMNLETIFLQLVIINLYIVQVYDMFFSSSFLMWLIGLHPFNFFSPSNLYYYMNPFDNPLQN